MSTDEERQPEQPPPRPLANSLASEIEDKLKATLLEADPEKLDAISQLSNSNIPKFASAGKDFAMQVIANYHRNVQGTKVKMSRKEVAESVIEWLAREVAKDVSNQLVDYTVTGVTKKRLGSSAKVEEEERVEGNLVLDAPLATETVATFAIEYQGATVSTLDFTIDIDAELTINDVVTKLQTEPVLKVEEIELRDAEASLEVSGPLGITIGEFKVPIKGEVTL